MNAYLSFVKETFCQDRCDLRKQGAFICLFISILAIFRENTSIVLMIYLIVLPICYLISCAVKFKLLEQDRLNNQ